MSAMSELLDGLYSIHLQLAGKGTRGEEQGKVLRLIFTLFVLSD
jgi:hypothetical protein